MGPRWHPLLRLLVDKPQTHVISMIYHIFSDKKGADGEDHEWPLLIEGKLPHLYFGLSSRSSSPVAKFQIYTATHTLLCLNLAMCFFTKGQLLFFGAAREYNRPLANSFFVFKTQ